MQRSLRRLINIIISIVIFIVGFIGLWGAGVWLLLGLVKRNVISADWNYVIAVIAVFVVGYYAYKAYITLEKNPK